MTELVVARPTSLEQYSSTSADQARLLAAAFLAGYAGRTREAYAADLKQWGAFCVDRRVEILDAARAHVQLYAAELAETGRSPATVARKLSAIAGFYKYAVVEGVLPKSPADHVRRPKVSDESTRLGLDKDELRSLLGAAAADSPQAVALVSLLALNGLRVSEVCNARASDLTTIRSHRILNVVRKGGKRAEIPLSPRTAATIDALQRAGDELIIGYDRYAAWRVVKRCVDAAGITKTISPHSLRHTFCTLGLDAGVDIRRMQVAMGHADSRTTVRYDRARRHLEDAPTYKLSDLIGGHAGS